MMRFRPLLDRRLDKFNTQIQIEETDLGYLPKNAFSFVFSWHHFEFLPYENCENCEIQNRKINKFPSVRIF